MGLQINYIRIIFAAYLRRQDQKSENHIFFSALKCHCYPEPHQDGGWYPRISKICFPNRTQLRGKNHYLSDGSHSPPSTDSDLSFSNIRFKKMKSFEEVKRCKHWVSLSPTFKSVTPLIFSLWVEDPEEEEESQDAGWPGHWCRDNVSLWEMERHQFSPDWLLQRQNIFFVLLVIPFNSSF